MLIALGPEWLKPDTILTWLGPWALVGLALIIFAECGLLLGFFLPGDSLLFTAGLFVADGAIDAPLWAVCALLVGAAVLGNATGYWVGRAAGPAVFDKPRSRLFKPHHVVKTQEFFDRYGNRAIVLGRFVPIVRTFITVMAGVGRMDARRYLTYSVIGGVAWAAGVTAARVLARPVRVRQGQHRADADPDRVPLGAADDHRGGAGPPGPDAPVRVGVGGMRTRPRPRTSLPSDAWGTAR